MSWFFIALIAPALWATSNHFDKFILNKYFKGVSAGAFMIFSVFIGLFIIITIPIFQRGIFSIPIASIITVVIGGALFLYAYIPYTCALQKDEASVVASLFQMIPPFSYLGAYFLLGETLTGAQIFAAIMIILGAIGISLDIEFGTIRFKTEVLVLMALSSLFFVINGLLFKFVAIRENFWTTIFWQYIGFSLAAVSLLAIKSYRQQFFKLLKIKGSSILSLSVLNEAINVVGEIIFSFASLLAPITLVWTVNGIQPFFVFILGIFITLFLPKFGEESLLKKHLVQKFISIAIMFIGMYFLNK